MYPLPLPPTDWNTNIDPSHRKESSIVKTRQMTRPSRVWILLHTIGTSSPWVLTTQREPTWSHSIYPIISSVIFLLEPPGDDQWSGVVAAVMESQNFQLLEMINNAIHAFSLEIMIFGV